jgi:hypothetical protein
VGSLPFLLSISINMSQQSNKALLKRSSEFFQFSVMSFIDDFIETTQEYLTDGLEELEAALNKATPEKSEEISQVLLIFTLPFSNQL